MKKLKLTVLILLASTVFVSSQALSGPGTKKPPQVHGTTVSAN